jgi:hypothetical protein
VKADRLARDDPIVERYPKGTASNYQLDSSASFAIRSAGQACGHRHGIRITCQSGAACSSFKTQRIPYLDAPASLFSFATLSAYGAILQIVTAKWTEEQVHRWNQLVDSVSEAIRKRNEALASEKQKSDARDKELIELQKETAAQRERIDDLKREIQRITGQYERELSRSERLTPQPPPIARPSAAADVPSRAPLLSRAAVVVVMIATLLFAVFAWYGSHGTQAPPTNTSNAELLTKIYDKNLPPPVRRDYLSQFLETGQERVFDSVDFSGMNLDGMNLAGASLRGAKLMNTSLRNASLESTDCAGADFTDANLSGANLRTANLRGANLQRTELAKADLRGANLTQVQNLSQPMLRTAILDEKTQLPTPREQQMR